MPVIPSFGAFAPKPNLASAFLGGAHIAQQAQESAARISMERQKLEQQHAQASLSFELKQKQLEQDNLIEQHRIEVAKQYHEVQTGLKKQQLEQAEQSIKIHAQQAARQYETTQKYQQRFRQLTDSANPDRMEPDAASRQAMLEINPGQFGGAGTAAVKPNRSAMELGGATPVAGLPENFKQVQTGAGSRRIINIPPAVAPAAKPVEGAPGYLEYRGKVMAEKQSEEEKSMRSDLKALQKVQRDDKDAQTAKGKSDSKKELSASQIGDLARYNKRQDEIDALKEKLKARPAASRIPLPESQQKKSKRFRFDPDEGKLVPVGD